MQFDDLDDEEVKEDIKVEKKYTFSALQTLNKIEHKSGPKEIRPVPKFL
jgi:hypothetical protein